MTPSNLRIVFAAAVAVSITLSADSLAQSRPSLPVDYSMNEDRNPYPEPADAGDGHYWWRGNIHTHTLWSDGDQFPEVVTQWYVEHGYHFLAISDHNQLPRGDKWINPETNRFIQSGGGMEAYELYRERLGADWVQTRETEDGQLEVRVMPMDEFRHLFEKQDRFLLIEGLEITEGRYTLHVNATNVGELIEHLRNQRPEDTVQETLRYALDAVDEQSERLERPILAHLNHPNARWTVTAEDMVPIENLKFFEVYNGVLHANNFGGGLRPDLDTVWDIVLTRRLAEESLSNLYGIAVDDAHHYENSDSRLARPGRGWIMVRSPSLTTEDLIEAMERGDFYSSTGIILRNIHVDSTGMEIEVEPQGNATYTIQFVGTRQDYDPSREYKLDDDGNPMKRITKKYSDDIGKILKEVQGTSARYEYKGDEIYVRARVVSSELHPDPFMEGERKKAWAQPVIPE